MSNASQKLSDLLAAATPGGVESKPATLTALREDGLVNISYQGSVFRATVIAPYSPVVGDRVHVIQANNMWVVLGKYSINPLGALSNAASSFAQYNRTGSWAGGTLASTAASSNNPQVGCSEIGADTTPLTLAWSYWNGSSNTLTTATATATTITFRFSRVSGDGGTDDYVSLRMYPHGYDALPASGFTHLGASYSEWFIALQTGQTVTVNAPSDWVSPIKSGTIKGIAIIPEYASNPIMKYAQLTTISASFNAT